MRQRKVVITYTDYEAANTLDAVTILGLVILTFYTGVMYGRFVPTKLDVVIIILGFALLLPIIVAPKNAYSTKEVYIPEDEET